MRNVLITIFLSSTKVDSMTIKNSKIIVVKKLHYVLKKLQNLLNEQVQILRNDLNPNIFI